jgi:ParB-like chromosome segregation protein Spo0J
MARVVNAKVELVAVERLSTHPENPRKGDVGAIGRSLESHGFYGVVVAQRSSGHVLVGNHRLVAALEAGMSKLPVAWLDVDDDEARRILLDDNRASDLAEYDEKQLAELLAELEASAAGLTGTLYDEAVPESKLEYHEVHLGGPLSMGHFLISYPLELHGDVWAAVGDLERDPRIKVRHSPGNLTES